MVSHTSRPAPPAGDGAPAATGGAGDAATAMDALRHLVHALRVSAVDAHRRTGISGAQLFVLQQLAQRSAASLQELAERTHTHQSSVSVVVGRLVDGGLVRREPDPGDRRRRRLVITADGRRAATAVPGTAQARLAEAFAVLPRDRRRQLASGLAAWVAAAGLESPRATFFFEEPPHARRPRR